MVFQIGLQAAGWATAAIEKTWINEVLFQELSEITVPTLIIHGIHDKVVPFELGEIQHQYIKSSTLLPFEFSGHASFYDQMEEFNKVLSDLQKETASKKWVKESKEAVGRLFAFFVCYEWLYKMV